MTLKGMPTRPPAVELSEWQNLRPIGEDTTSFDLGYYGYEIGEDVREEAVDYYGASAGTSYIARSWEDAFDLVLSAKKFAPLVPWFLLDPVNAFFTMAALAVDGSTHLFGIVPKKKRYVQMSDQDPVERGDAKERSLQGPDNLSTVDGVKARETNVSRSRRGTTAGRKPPAYVRFGAKQDLKKQLMRVSPAELVKILSLGRLVSSANPILDEIIASRPNESELANVVYLFRIIDSPEADHHPTAAEALQDAAKEVVVRYKLFSIEKVRQRLRYGSGVEKIEDIKGLLSSVDGKNERTLADFLVRITIYASGKDAAPVRFSINDGVIPDLPWDIKAGSFTVYFDTMPVANLRENFENVFTNFVPGIGDVITALADELPTTAGTEYVFQIRRTYGNGSLFCDAVEIKNGDRLLWRLTTLSPKDSIQVDEFGSNGKRVRTRWFSAFTNKNPFALKEEVVWNGDGTKKDIPAREFMVEEPRAMVQKPQPDITDSANILLAAPPARSATGRVAPVKRKSLTYGEVTWREIKEGGDIPKIERIGVVVEPSDTQDIIGRINEKNAFLERAIGGLLINRAVAEGGIVSRLVVGYSPQIANRHPVYELVVQKDGEPVLEAVRKEGRVLVKTRFTEDPVPEITADEIFKDYYPSVLRTVLLKWHKLPLGKNVTWEISIDQASSGRRDAPRIVKLIAIRDGKIVLKAAVGKNHNFVSVTEFYPNGSGKVYRYYYSSIRHKILKKRPQTFASGKIDNIFGKMSEIDGGK